MLSFPFRHAAGGVLAQALVTGALLSLWVHPAQADPAVRAQSEQQLINWYYSTVFGTGVYSAGDRSVTVLQLPFSYRLREADHQGRWGVQLRMPVSFGFYDFDFEDLANGGAPESVSTVSAFPGVEAELRVSERWRLRPFAYVGYGRELDGTDSAALYSVGAKSRLTFPLAEGQIVYGVTLNHAAYVTGGERRPLTMVVAGVDLFFPTGARVWGRAVDLGMHFANYYYVEGLLFPMADNVNNTERSETEIGISLRTSKPLDFKLFSADMLGLAVRAGNDVTAVRLFLGLPY